MQIEVTSRDMLYVRSLLAGNSHSQGMEFPEPSRDDTPLRGRHRVPGRRHPGGVAFVMSVATGVTAAIIAD